MRILWRLAIGVISALPGVALSQPPPISVPSDPLAPPGPPGPIAPQSVPPEQLLPPGADPRGNANRKATAIVPPNVDPAMDKPPPAVDPRMTVFPPADTRGGVPPVNPK